MVIIPGFFPYKADIKSSSELGKKVKNKYIEKDITKEKTEVKDQKSEKYTKKE